MVVVTLILDDSKQVSGRSLEECLIKIGFDPVIGQRHTFEFQSFSVSEELYEVLTGRSSNDGIYDIRSDGDTV